MDTQPLDDFDNAPHCEECGARLHPLSSTICVCDDETGTDEWKRFTPEFSKGHDKLIDPQSLGKPDPSIYETDETGNDEWKRFGRKGFTEMRPVTQDDIDYFQRRGNIPSYGGTTIVSISDVDLNNGSPKIGDMIARNEDNKSDQWLVNETFFNDNYYTG